MAKEMNKQKASSSKKEKDAYKCAENEWTKLNCWDSLKENRDSYIAGQKRR